MAKPKKLPKSWQLFEQEVTELVAAFGYQAETTQPSHDFGVDVIATSEKRRIIIQCKLYGKGKIGGPTITQLMGSKQIFKADEAICITTSAFTKDAQNLASQGNVHLLDRSKLISMCKEKQITLPSFTSLEVGNKMCVLLNVPTLTIGRAEDNDIVMNSMKVSRHHVRLDRKGLRLTLQDCGSSNGTFINGKSLLQPITLNYEDEFLIDGTTFRVSFHMPNT